MKYANLLDLFPFYIYTSHSNAWECGKVAHSREHLSMREKSLSMCMCKYTMSIYSVCPSFYFFVSVVQPDCLFWRR